MWARQPAHCACQTARFATDSCETTGKNDEFLLSVTDSLNFCGFKSTNELYSRSIEESTRQERRHVGSSNDILYSRLVGRYHPLYQVGRGSGRAAATAVGVIGGAVAGNAIEGSSGGTGADQSYRLTIQFDRGGYRAYDVGSVGDLRTGDRVRVYNGQISRY